MATKSRAANGDGSIRQRPDGTWEARITSGINPGTGKQMRKSFYGKTKTEAAQKKREYLAKHPSGTCISESNMTLGEWLELWPTYLTNVKASTQKKYRSTVVNHIKPALGAVKLKALTDTQVQTFINNLENRKDSGEPLSPKTVKNIHGTLHMALQTAIEKKLITNNVATGTNLPPRMKPQVVPLQDEEVTVFCNAIKGHRFELLYIVALLTGMREGEILGLQWSDINFDKGTLTISRQLQYLGRADSYKLISPKNKKYRTLVPAAQAMDTLRRQFAKQEKARELAGNAWTNVDNLVFTDALGNHLKHDIVYRDVKRIYKQIGVPDLNFHTLRHTYATMSLQAGDDVKTVQENMGHYSAAFTMDQYAFVTDGMKKKSADRMSAYIQALGVN